MSTPYEWNLARLPFRNKLDFFYWSLWHIFCGMGYEPISFFWGDIHWISSLHTTFNSPQEWGYMRTTLTHTCFAVAMSTESLSTLFSYNPGRKRLVVQSLRMVNLQGTYVLSFFLTATELLSAVSRLSNQHLLFLWPMCHISRDITSTSLTHPDRKFW